MILRVYTTSNLNKIKDKIPDSELKVFLDNPFLYEDAPVKIQFEDNQKVLGSVYAFPIQIVYNNTIYRACAGSTLRVIPESRGMGLAKIMTEERIEVAKDKIAIASGLSNMSLPLFKKLGFDIFTLKRNIYLKDSRAVLEIFFKNKMLLKVLSKGFNLPLKLINFILKKKNEIQLKNIIIEEVTNTPIEIEEIVGSDPALFRENHTKEWFDWVLKSKFNPDYRNTQHLFILKDKSEIVGFFMTKERFHEKASHRGFKNIILGSVIEWGVKPNRVVNEKNLLLCAILSFGKHVDAIEICTPYNNINKYLKKHFLVSVGESNFAIKAGKNSPILNYPDYHIGDNWRLRPAASDNSFN